MGQIFLQLNKLICHIQIKMIFMMIFEGLKTITIVFFYVTIEEVASLLFPKVLKSPDFRYFLCLDPSGMKKITV